MSNVVNLNQARKKKTREAKRDRADQNVALFGRTKSERKTEKEAADRAARLLDGHRRDPEAPTDGA